MSHAWLGPRALSVATGVSTDTLRHYERFGLLPAVQRTRSGYRRYHPSTADRVRVIQRALSIGFTLKELASVLRQRDHGAPPCRRVRMLVGERLAALEARLAELVALRVDIRVLLREWDARLAQTHDGQRALLLDMLAARPEARHRMS
jgi:DNA-binding transcriptional MerR regulator